MKANLNKCRIKEKNKKIGWDFPYLLQSKKSEEQFSQLFDCKMGSSPFHYLGIPMTFRKLNNNGWKMIKDRIERKLCGWRAKNLWW